MKYLSKLLSMFLVGAMLYSTGCTDYDEDIANLNDKVDNLEQELVNGQINPLKADLAATKAALEAAIETAKSEILTQHEADVKTLKEADAKAEEAIEAALKAIKDGDDALDKKIADAVTAIGEANKKIEALETVDTQIKENLTTLENSLKATQGDVENLEGDVESLKGDVESLKQLAMQLTAWSANVDSAIATINTKIEDIEESIEDLEGNVETLKEFYQQQIEWNQNMDGRVGNLEEFKSFAEEQFEALADADKNLETLIANTAETLRGELKDYQDIVRTQFEQAFDDIAKNTTAINNLTADLQAKYEELVAVDKALQDAIATHEEWITNAEGRITNLEEDMVEVKENLEKLQKDYNAFKEDVTTRLRNAEGSIGQLQVDVQGLNDKLNEFKAAYDKHIEAYNDFVEKTNSAITDMKAIIEALVGRVQSIAFVPEYEDGMATIEWAVIGSKDEQGVMDDVYLVQRASTFTYQIMPVECATAFAAGLGQEGVDIWFEIEGLKTRADEEVGLNIVDIKVKDAERGLIDVVAVANLNSEFYTKVSTTTPDVFTEYAVALAINDGNNKQASCYTKLVMENERYADIIDVQIYRKNEVITNKHEYPALEPIEYTRRIGGTKSEDYRHLLLGHDVLYSVNGGEPTIWENLVNMEDVYFTIEQPEFMYTVKAFDKIDGNNLVPVENNELLKYFKYDTLWGPEVLTGVKAGEYARYKQAIVPEVRLQGEDDIADHVGARLEYAFNYLANGVELVAYSDVVIGQDKASVTFDEFDIVWNYDLDAAQDAIYYSNEPASYEGTNYSRVAIPLTSKEKFDGVEWSEIINAGVPQTIKAVSDKGHELTDVKFVIREGEPAISVAGFQWGHRYTVIAQVEINSVKAELAVKFETSELRNNDPVVVGTVEVNVPLVQDIAFENANNAANMTVVSNPTAEEGALQVLNAVQTTLDERYDLGTFAGEEKTLAFLAEVFKTHGYVDATVINATTTQSDATKKIEGNQANTKYTIETEGTYAFAGFDFNDFNFVPEKVVYTKNVTLWYGQPVVMEYVINFVEPYSDYKFAHTVFVSNDSIGWYSNTQAAYYHGIEKGHSDNTTAALRHFEIIRTDMDRAFNVYAMAEDNYLLDKQDFIDRGLYTYFSLKDNTDPGITIEDNKITYHGKADYVYVVGQLFLKHTNGAIYEIKSASGQFTNNVDETKYVNYTGYRVNKFNPLSKPMVDDTKDLRISIEQVNKYYVDVREYFNIYETRNGDGKTPTLITNAAGDSFYVDIIGEDGEWLVGNNLNGWSALGFDFKPVTPYSLYNVEGGTPFWWGFNNVSVNIPAQHKNYIKWDANNYLLIFDNTQDMQLLNEVAIDVTLTIDHTWASVNEKDNQATARFVFTSPYVVK